MDVPLLHHDMRWYTYIEHRQIQKGLRMAEKNRGLMLKVGLLSISITMGTQMAISPALPDIMKAFPEKTTTQVETLTTVQSITGLVFVLLCPLVASFLGKKRTVLLGLLVSGISGLVPLLSSMLSGVGMDNGTFTMNGGTITGCSASNGGGVWMNNTSKFYMNGGTITGNSLTVETFVKNSQQ